MKKQICLFVSLVLFAFSAATVKAATYTDDSKIKKEDVASMTEEQKQERIQQIKIRVDEIKAMDKSKLTNEERKELRTELKSMKAEARLLSSNGVYLSVGAIIVIVVVLILIL